MIPQVQNIDVSVIMPVHNGMPYLRESLDSLLAQDIDPARFELIAVDDGSTDDSVLALREYESNFMNCNVVELEHTGSPAVPRNVGIDKARGDYIFFLDADDLLAPYALSEMVATANANGVDIVVPKQRPLGGRSVPIQAFRTTLPKTDIYEADVYRVLGPVKLFRTSFVRENRLRFPEGFPRKSDVPFGVEAYLLAGSISVMADKDYVVIRLRDDGGNLTVNRTALRDHLPVVRFVFETVPAHVPAGPHRDRLMTRHFRTELAKAILEGFPGEDDDAFRLSCYQEFAGFAREYCNQRVLLALPVRERIVAHLLLEDRYDDLIRLAARLQPRMQAEVVAAAGGFFLAFPGFREPEFGIPDSIFGVGVGSCVQVSLVDAAVGQEGLELEFVCRILVTNSPARVVGVLLRSASRRTRVPVGHVDVRDQVVADVREIRFSIEQGQLGVARRDLHDGHWTVVVSVVVGDVALEVPIYYLDTARTTVDAYLTPPNRRRVPPGDGPSRGGLRLGKSSHGRLVVVQGSRIGLIVARAYAVFARMIESLSRLSR